MRHLFRAEFRKLTTTPMPLVFLAVLVGFAVINAFIVIAGTDFDGSKTFISTAADQQSLIAFGSNGFILAGLFGAIASSREYGYHTAIPTFLAAPRRHRAVEAQFGAVAIVGGLLSLVGAALTAAAVALALPTTEYPFLVATEQVIRILGAATFTGAAGALLGAGIGVVLRSVGGAVTGTTLALIIVPPLIVQLATGTEPWLPNALTNALAGVRTDVSSSTAALVLATWALIPATIGLITVQRRDVV